MDRSQVKSAPPRLKSKFVKNKTNAMKEIQAWIRKDEEFSVPEASRMSGQLSDNVTEERMLKAKLWELSKERYKFLSQNSYEKKMFQDRQQRKANNRRVVSASADGRSRHASEDARKERRSSVGDLPQKPKIRNARLALLDRLDPTNKKRGKGKRPSQEETSTKDGRQTPARQCSRTNSSMSLLKHTETKLSIKQGVANKDIGLPPSSTNQNRTGTPSERNSAKPNENPFVENSRRPTSSANPFSRTVPASTDISSPPVSSTTQPLSSSTPSSSATTGAAASSGSQGSWSQTMSGQHDRKYGMRVESKVTDPRYSSLEKRLSPLIRSNKSGDVSSIVNTIESLHVRPKRRAVDSNRSRTKIEVKALEFIKEKGFAF